MNRRSVLLLAGFLGLAGVAAGAFGAHTFKALLTARQTLPLWEKGVFYQMIHAVVLLWLASQGSGRTPALPVLSLVLGIVCFSGSLYVLALWGEPFCMTGCPALMQLRVALVLATPLGGLLLLAGWFWIAFRAAKRLPAGNP